MGPCCVEGCKSNKDGISYFEFPTSRNLRTKWLQMVQIPSKVPLGTVVCSQHFNESDYEVVRGKVRLKRKVVPTLRLNTKPPETSETPPKCTEELTIPNLPEDPIQNGNNKRKTKSLTKEEKKRSKSTRHRNRSKSSTEDSQEETEESKRSISRGVKKRFRPSRRRNKSRSSTEENGDQRKRSTREKKICSSGGQKRSISSKEESSEENGDGKKKSTKEGVKKRSRRSTDSTEGSIEEERRSITRDKRSTRRNRSKSPTEGSGEENEKGEREKRSISPTREEVNKRSYRNSGNKTEEESEKICAIERSSKTSVDRPPHPEPDLKHPPDFEDMITNYQIKNSKPNALLPEIEIEVPPVSAMDDTIVINDKDAAPVFIEINVDKDKTTSEDCLMVLESVQVEVDPSTLMLERDSDEEQDLEPVASDVEARKDQGTKDPISLLTSSDDDDVIIEEPHIDTVEVSDETDEDDMPLVKLVPKKPPTPPKPTKKPTKKKKTKPKPTKVNLKNLVWSGTYDNYCLRCNLTFLDATEFNAHKSLHQTVLQVCSICNYTSGSKPQFTRHMRKHKEERRFKCHLCDYRARHNMSLIYHLQSHETTSEDSFRCMKCGFQCDKKLVLLKHVRECIETKLFVCDRCDYVTKRRNDLKRHWLRKHIDTVDIESDTEESKVDDGDE